MRVFFLVAILFAAAIAITRLVPLERREALSQTSAAVRARIKEGMQQHMKQMAPCTSSLDELREQNEQVLGLLREQNDLLRERLPAGES